jgi:membrane protease YdiL (CAAX protease family)
MLCDDIDDTPSIKQIQESRIHGRRDTHDGRQHRREYRYAPVPVTLVLGVVWALWHSPLLATNPTTLHGLTKFIDIAPSIGVRIPNIVGIAFILTWIYNETGSVLLAILAHTGFNTANSTLVPLPLDIISASDSTTIPVVTTVAIWVIVPVLFATTRGQFGYETEPDRASTQTHSRPS